MTEFDGMRVALVHEWLDTFAGSERVVEEILKIFPQAELFSVVDFFDSADRSRLGGRSAKTTFVQNLPFARKRFRSYLPLMPVAIEQLDLSAYDLVLSSSHAVAKGVITGPDQVHVSYVHSPMRYAWDLQHRYLQEAGMTRGLRSLAARAMLHYLRIWDARTATGVDRFVANSAFIGRRIRKVYGRASDVVHPPVDVTAFDLGTGRDPGLYLVVSRLVPYKRVALLAEAFELLPDRRLVIIGDGPEQQRVRALAGPNVTLLGRQPFAVVREHMMSARGFLIAAEEDFGITSVEAQACGTPIVALARGGSLETVRDLDAPAPSGTFFHQQTPDAVAAAVRTLEAYEDRFDREGMRAATMRFSPEAFRKNFSSVVTSALRHIRP